jgi:hypothetical protein
LSQVPGRLLDIIRAADLPERQAFCDALIEASPLSHNETATSVLRIAAA